MTEKRARGKKKTMPAEPIPNARYWIATGAHPGFGTQVVALVLECERWFDARTVAMRVLGVDRVDIAPLDASKLEALPGRLQVRWAGTAAGLPNLRLQTRRVERGERAELFWKDLG